MLALQAVFQPSDYIHTILSFIQSDSREPGENFILRNNLQSFKTRIQRCLRLILNP